MLQRSDRSRVTFVGVAASISFALVLSACAASRQPRGTPEESGFLGDYSQLEKGKRDQMALVYIAPGVDWKSYTGVIFESVTLWPGPEGHLEKLSPEDQKMLADYLYTSVHDALAKVTTLTTTPGPGVLRLRVALTEAKANRVLMNAVATIVPQIRTVTTIAGLAANTSLTVGEATIEGDVTDSVTHRRLAAFDDERIGQRSMRGLGTWSQVDAAFDVWGQQLANRLVALREGKPVE